MTAEIKPNHEGACDFEGVKPKKEGQQEERQCRKEGCQVTVGVHVAQYWATAGRDRWRG